MIAEHEWLSFPDAPRIRVPPPGPESRRLLERQHELESEAVVYPKHFPIAIREARGSTIEDVDGNRYIDWVSGISVLNLGHRHPRLQAALLAQSEKIWHSLELPTETRVRFLETLGPLLPGTMRGRSRVLFTVTGGDAVETAVNIAEHVKGRRGVVAFSGAYHGVHGGAANLTSGKRFHQTTAFHGGQITRVPFPDPYRPLLDRDGSSAGTIAYLEHLVSDPYSGVDDLAAVVVEPILGEGGYIVPPSDFLPSLREFCDRHDLLLIADEIQTGLGRTGKMWAVEHAGVTPDILCVAKSIGGGIPVSLVAYRNDLGRELPPGFHLGTYRGNPLALAVGTEVLKVLHEEEWPKRTARRGEQLQQRFREIATRHPSLGDVRGKGFMIGLEFVSDPLRRTPWGDRAKQLRRQLLANGVLMHTCGPYDQVLRFIAPLTIEDELLERGVAAFEEAFNTLDAQPLAGNRPPTGTVQPAPEHPPGAWIPPPHHLGPAPPPPPGRSQP
ncbi:MAG: aspartate aminotransferase family protein [Thermoplasmata archaeon]|nr:aspartate aminotransferase family protein [Thermoplasmata archaeon]MCI4354502.1 aspartate aminotransferase family protein [Thermoplasmata archaeon]